MGDAPVRSYVPPEGYGHLDNYAGGSNQDYSNIYADSSSNNYAYGSVSGAVYADSLSGNSIDAANGESLLPAYRLPGKPDLYGLSGNSDTYVLHGQQYSTDTESLDKWPAVSQPDNELTQGGLTKGKKWLRSWTKELKDTNPLMSSLLVICLGWCSNFVGSESGQIQSVKLLQNMVYSTIQHPPLQSHTLSVYSTVH